MLKRLRSLGLLVLVPFLSLPTLAFAKTRHKTTKHSAVKTTVKGDGKHRSDPEMRTLLRKQAPFYVEERFRGDTIRLNKDGTFSREGDAGAYATEGHWKIASAKLKLKWSTGEEYSYRMAFSGRTPIIAGHKPNKQRRYVIVSAD